MAMPSAVAEGLANADKVRAELYGNPEAGADGEADKATLAPVEAAEEKAKVDPEDYKERFSRYKATTDSTIHGLRTELAVERDRNQELEDRLKTLEEAVASAPAPNGAGVQLSEDELDLLDEETAAVVRKIVDAQVKPLQERQKVTDSELERERNLRVADAQEKKAQSFQSRLTDIVADALTLDKDPEFRKWLSGFDDVSGRQRLELARAAKAADDVHRVASFYQDWQAEQGRADPREEYISPDRAADAGPPGAPTGRQWTRAEIKGFYAAKREGQIAPEEAKRIEQDIFAAQREGRIR